MNAGLDGRICLALLYAASAAACVLADTCSSATTRDMPAPTPVWRWSAVLLLVMALNALLQIDQAFVLWARELAMHANWYAFRRPMQVAALLVLVTGIAMQVQGCSHDEWGVNTPHCSARSDALVLGLGLLLGLTTMRFVSLHHTDQMLDWHLAGWRLGRLVELAGLGLVLLASVLKTLRGS